MHATDMFDSACICGVGHIVKTGLEQGIRLSAADRKGRPALHFAALFGSAAVVDLLIVHGADANHEDPVYGTLLRAALGRSAGSNFGLPELPKYTQAYARSLRRKPLGPGRRVNPYPVINQAEECEKIVLLLLQKGAHSTLPPGTLSCSLTWAEILVAPGEEFASIEDGVIRSPSRS